MTALAFTSGNGVAAFAALTPERGLPVFAVGDATAAAAREAGFTAVRSASGDLGDLAGMIAAAGLDGRLLVPGAREPSGDLPSVLAGRGGAGRVGAGRVRAEALAVYAAVETDVAAPGRWDAVLIHSRRAALALATRGADVARGRRAVVISAAAAEPLAALPFREIRVAGAPTEAALLEALGNPAPAV